MEEHLLSRGGEIFWRDYKMKVIIYTESDFFLPENKTVQISQSDSKAMESDGDTNKR